jgi:REP element-mobilizing transposase RayT
LRPVTDVSPVRGKLGGMGRRPRDYHPSFIYHLTTHGVDDRPIFCDDVDRQDLVRRLLRISGRDGWEWHAACLMDTHYHLLIRPTLGRVSAGMRDLNSAYCRAFNKRHGRRGALLEARYGEKTIRAAPAGGGAVHRAQPGRRRDGREARGLALEHLRRQRVSASSDAA